MTKEQIEAAFRAWWQASYGMPPGIHAVMTHVGFVEYLLQQMAEDYQGLTPPPELVEQWYNECPEANEASLPFVATQAARWGADQELEACVKFLSTAQYGDTFGWYSLKEVAVDLRADRRPQSPSLKEQALQAAQRFYAKGHENCTDEEVKDDFDTIRRALEQLDD